MRTTITLTPEADALVRRAMRLRGITFKDAVNEAVIRGLSETSERPRFSTPTFDMGTMRVPLDRAVALAAELENEDLLRKQELGK